MAKQIMVVDNDAGVLELLGLMLKRAGYDVMKAESAFEALAILQHTTPDLIIADIMMPCVDGTELCKRVRSRAETAQTPVIMLSAQSDLEYHINNAYKAGANHHLSKPILVPALLASVREMLVSHEVFEASKMG